jgi:hypothetical protein
MGGAATVQAHPACGPQSDNGRVTVPPPGPSPRHFVGGCVLPTGQVSGRSWGRLFALPMTARASLNTLLLTRVPDLVRRPRYR